MPNRDGADPKCRKLNVTSASARPLTAASSTISSPGSRSCGLQRKCVLTGSAMAITAVTKISTSRAESPDASWCSASQQTASYSIAKATLTRSVISPCRTARKMAADAPPGLRIPATTASVSSTILTLPTISHGLRYYNPLSQTVRRALMGSNGDAAAIPARRATESLW
jgi:hypothetical protein